MIIKNQFELDMLKKAGSVVSNTLQLMLRSIEEGMTTLELDLIAQKNFEKFGAQSAPKLTYNFPGHTCISINEEVAHGIPGDKIIRNGDLINIDVSCELNGFFADTGASIQFGEEDPKLAELMATTKKALKESIKKCRPGKRLNLIGQTIETTARRSGFTVIENIGSHGVGGSLHEAPEFIAGYYDPQDRRLIHEGQVFTIEPFISTGAHMVEEQADKWTLSTSPKFRTAQYEHTIVITKNSPIILTSNPYI